MAGRILKGKEETLTAEEVKRFKGQLLDEFLVYMVSVINEATDGEEERANIELNLSSKLGSLLGMERMYGFLIDPDMYISELKGGFEDMELTVSPSE